MKKKNINCIITASYGTGKTPAYFFSLAKLNRTGNSRIDEAELNGFIEKCIGSFAEKQAATERPVSKEQLELYRDFLYCAITGPSVRSDGGTGCLMGYEPVKSIEDILEMAAHYDIFTDPDHMNEFESGRCGASSEADSFFLLMNNAYAYLTGTELAHYDPGHEEIPVFPEDHELYPDVADDLYEVEELTEEAYEEQEQALFEILTEEAGEKRKAWRRQLPDEKLFCEKYLRLRELYFKTDPGKLEADIRACLECSEWHI